MLDSPAHWQQVQSMVEDIFDVVNERDEVIGRAPRKEVHAKGLMHRAVHVLVLNARGEVFLQKRSMKKDRQPGKWDSSAAGHVDSGETYDVCAVRELQEEIGWKSSTPLERLFKLPASEQTDQEHVWIYRCNGEGPFTLQPKKSMKAAGSILRLSTIGSATNPTISLRPSSPSGLDSARFNYGTANRQISPGANSCTCGFNSRLLNPTRTLRGCLDVLLTLTSAILAVAAKVNCSSPAFSNLALCALIVSGPVPNTNASPLAKPGRLLTIRTIFVAALWLFGQHHVKLRAIGQPGRLQRLQIFHCHIRRLIASQQFSRTLH